MLTDIELQALSIIRKQEGKGYISQPVPRFLKVWATKERLIAAVKKSKLRIG